ncbi:MAG: hypothetical protein ABSB15_17550 [Bryobacteraceae bacterium]
MFAVPALTLAQYPAPAAAGTVAISIPAPSTVYQPLTPLQKAERRALNLITPETLLTSSFSAGIGQWRDTPPQWGEGAEGFGRRFADAEGYIAVHNSIAFGFDVAFHLDPRYRRMPQARFIPRLRNAVTQTFVANKDAGGKMINVSEIGGNFGAGMIANEWEPKGYRSVGDGLSRGAFGIGYDVLRNVFREFGPDLMHPGRRASSGKISELEHAFTGQ